MSQAGVIEWLAAHPGWHYAAEVVQDTGQCRKTVQVSLFKAKSWGDIEGKKDGFRKLWRAP